MTIDQEKSKEGADVGAEFLKERLRGKREDLYRPSGREAEQREMSSRCFEELDGDGLAGGITGGECLFPEHLDLGRTGVFGKKLLVRGGGGSGLSVLAVEFLRAFDRAPGGKKGFIGTAGVRLLKFPDGVCKVFAEGEFRET